MWLIWPLSGLPRGGRISDLKWKLILFTWADIKIPPAMDYVIIDSVRLFCKEAKVGECKRNDSGLVAPHTLEIAVRRATLLAAEM